MKLKQQIHKPSEGVVSAAVYTVSTMFSRGLAIITVPVFTRLMSTEQMGIVTLYNSWYSLLSAIATLSLTSGGFAVAMKEYSEHRDEYQSSVLSLTSLVAIILGVVYFGARSTWNRVIGLPTSLMVLMLIGFLFAPARDFWLARQRYEYKYKLPGAIMIISALLASLLSVWVVVFLNSKDVESTAVPRLVANYVIMYGVSGVLWVILLLRGKTFYHKEYWKMSLQLSIPLVGYSIAAQILNVSDRVIIDQMVSKSAVGIYGTLYTVSSISLMVWQAINASFVPYLFQKIEKCDSEIKKVATLLLSAYGVVAVLCALFAPEIVRILATDEYYSAIYIMPPIAAGVFFTSVANMYSNIAVYYKKTKIVMYPAVIAAIVNLVLNFIFIQMFGYMAAAYTTLISYILLAFLQARWAVSLHRNISQSNQSVYDDRRIVLISIIVVMMTMSGMLLYQNSVLRYSVCTATMVIGILCLYRVCRKRMGNVHNS